MASFNYPDESPPQPCELIEIGVVLLHNRDSDMATRDNRSYILNRRRTGIADLTARTPLNGEVTVEQAEKLGFYNINCSHQIGIATSTEVGLPPERVPIRVIVGAGDRAKSDYETVAHYWMVTDAAGKPVPFSRKALTSDKSITSLYKHVPDLDDMLWGYVEAVRYRCKDVKFPANDDYVAMVNGLFALTETPNPTDEQQSVLITTVAAIVSSAVEAGTNPFFKLTDTQYMWGVPHGVAYATKKKGKLQLLANRIANHESALCIKLNYAELKKRNPEVSDGTLRQCAYAIAGCFRFGLAECYEHREFHTAYVDAVEEVPGSYKVYKWEGCDGSDSSESYPIGSVHTISDVKLDPAMAEIGNLYVYLSGVMHYMFNHTTGGMLVQGPLMATMTMYNLYTREIAQEAGVRITSALYESLHPVNKRAIAALFFKDSGVHTYGRVAGAPRHEKLLMDTFARIRSQPYPAGSHKAYLCLVGLKKVLQSGMAPFLPWAGEVTSCINMCAEVLKSGARAHIGSHYYTGEYPRAQSSSIDQYLPEIAAYVNTFHRNDTLCFSAHLSQEQASRASMNWVNMLKGMRANDISATSLDVVKKFLQTQGMVKYPEDEVTWAGARQAVDVGLQQINAVNL